MTALEKDFSLVILVPPEQRRCSAALNLASLS